MIQGIGMDLIELDRIENSIDKDNRLADRVLTAKEKEMFHQLPNKTRQVEFLAGRFAAKEAFAKAVGTGIGQLSFQDIEILTNDNGAPVIEAIGYEANRIFVSITHSRDYAAAQVVVERTEGNEL
ncbi:MAG TPA: holo-ACP synthase [Bacillota bacterium]|nr:holo-ACP synthase [Bacillota bacterium]